MQLNAINPLYKSRIYLYVTFLLLLVLHASAQNIFSKLIKNIKQVDFVQSVKHFCKSGFVRSQFILKTGDGSSGGGGPSFFFDDENIMDGRCRSLVFKHVDQFEEISVRLNCSLGGFREKLVFALFQSGAGRVKLVDMDDQDIYYLLEKLMVVVGDAVVKGFKVRELEIETALPPKLSWRGIASLKVLMTPSRHKNLPHAKLLNNALSIMASSHQNLDPCTAQESQYAAISAIVYSSHKSPKEVKDEVLNAMKHLYSSLSISQFELMIYRLQQQAKIRFQNIHELARYYADPRTSGDLNTLSVACDFYSFSVFLVRADFSVTIVEGTSEFFRRDPTVISAVVMYHDHRRFGVLGWRGSFVHRKSEIMNELIEFDSLKLDKWYLSNAMFL